MVVPAAVAVCVRPNLILSISGNTIVLLDNVCVPVVVTMVLSIPRVTVLLETEAVIPLPPANVNVPPPETEPVPEVPANEIVVDTLFVEIEVILP